MQSNHDSAQADGERAEDAHLPECPRSLSTSWVIRSGDVTRPRTGRAFIGTRPSRKSNEGHLRRDQRDDAESAPIGNLQPQSLRKSIGSLRGWGNYFCLGAVSRAYRAVDNHARHRLRQWLNGKHRSRGVHPIRYPATYLHEELGLLQLERRTRNLPWAKA